MKTKNENENDQRAILEAVVQVIKKNKTCYQRVFDDNDENTDVDTIEKSRQRMYLNIFNDSLDVYDSDKTETMTSSTISTSPGNQNGGGSIEEDVMVKIILDMMNITRAVPAFEEFMKTIEANNLLEILRSNKAKISEKFDKTVTTSKEEDILFNIEDLLGALQVYIDQFKLSCSLASEKSLIDKYFSFFFQRDKSFFREEYSKLLEVTKYQEKSRLEALQREEKVKYIAKLTESLKSFCATHELSDTNFIEEFPNLLRNIPYDSILRKLEEKGLGEQIDEFVKQYNNQWGGFFRKKIEEDTAQLLKSVLLRVTSDSVNSTASKEEGDMLGGLKKASFKKVFRIFGRKSAKQRNRKRSKSVGQARLISRKRLIRRK